LERLIDSFGDQIAILASLVLLERRPVLIKGFIESNVLRELRFLAPHRDIYEIGRNMPNTTSGARQFLSDLQSGEKLPTNDPLKRSLILAPNIDSALVEEFLRFSKAWVASCVTTPKQESVQRSNVAIYDINCRKWLNVDTAKIEIDWIGKVIQQALAKKSDELSQAYLDLVITDVWKKASTLYKYVLGGTTENIEIWTDLGKPDQQTKKIIKILCKAEFNLDVNQVLNENDNNSLAEESLARKQQLDKAKSRRSDTVEAIIERIVNEENDIRKCVEAIRSELA
jgi:hypothetical protein